MARRQRVALSEEDACECVLSFYPSSCFWCRCVCVCVCARLSQYLFERCTSLPPCAFQHRYSNLLCFQWQLCSCIRSWLYHWLVASVSLVTLFSVRLHWWGPIVWNKCFTKIQIAAIHLSAVEHCNLLELECAMPCEALLIMEQVTSALPSLETQAVAVMTCVHEQLIFSTVVPCSLPATYYNVYTCKWLCITASWLFTYGYKSIQIQLHLGLWYLQRSHTSMVSECYDGHIHYVWYTISSMEKYTCFTNNAKPLLCSWKRNLTIIKLLIMTTYMCCSYNTTTFGNCIGTHIFTTTAIY